MGEFGTAGIVLSQNEAGGLPTRNWSSGIFEGAEAISGERMAKTVLSGRDTCFGCVVRCRRVVEITDGPFRGDPRYGGPEYETLATMGSYCGVSDLAAICRANQLCNMYGMDTIACGATIAWAMDCFEHGLLTKVDTDGVALRFGNAEALVQMVEKIGKREGFGRVLGEGSARAAESLGVGKDLVVAAKKHEFPAHMPQVKRSLALIYDVNPFGADHQSHEHDPSYEGYPERMAELARRCFYVAKAECGPTQLNIPRDYFYGDIECDIFRTEDVSRGAGPESQLEQAAQLLAGADYPVILAGGGVSIADAVEETEALAEYLAAPVVNSYLHNDSFPANLCYW